MPTGFAAQAYVDADHRSIDELASLVATRTQMGAFPHAVDIVREVVVDDVATFEATAVDPALQRSVMTELTDVLRDGPGVLLVRGAVPPAVAEAWNPHQLDATLAAHARRRRTHG